MLIENNKKAYFEYFIEETFEAGIALEGCEVKSIRKGGISLKESFCSVTNGEVFLKNCHITPYDKGSTFNSDPRRDRKLLLNKAEIKKLFVKTKTKGYTIIPTKAYLKGGRVKIEIALALGKHLYDKRESLKEKDIKRETDRQIRG